MFKRYLTFILALVLGSALASAQIAQIEVPVQPRELKTVKMDSLIFKLNKMTASDYANLELPPLDLLFDNARHYSNAVLAVEEEVIQTRLDVKKTKAEPLGWIRLVATYNYGNSDIAAISLAQTTYQVWSQSQASQRTSFYNAGATLSIPLSDIFTQKTKNRQAESRLRQLQFLRDAALDDVKRQIIELYCSVVEKISTLQAMAEELVLAQGQFTFAERDFVNNQLDALDLYRSKGYESSATMSYQNLRSQLVADLLSLEILSCTAIVSDYKLPNYDEVEITPYKEVEKKQKLTKDERREQAEQEKGRKEQAREDKREAREEAREARRKK